MLLSFSLLLTVTVQQQLSERQVRERRIRPHPVSRRNRRRLRVAPLGFVPVPLQLCQRPQVTRDAGPGDDLDYLTVVGVAIVSGQKTSLRRRGAVVTGGDQQIAVGDREGLRGGRGRPRVFSRNDCDDLLELHAASAA